jgi:hypothetical protein
MADLEGIESDESVGLIGFGTVECFEIENAGYFEDLA